MICLASSSHSIATVFLFNGLIMLFLIISNVSFSYGGNNETDYQALVKFKSMITKDPYDFLSSWNDSFHFCDWGNVLCDKRIKRVVGVNLMSKGLEGSLSPFVGNLTFLRIFLLVNNSFKGTIPQDLVVYLGYVASILATTTLMESFQLICLVVQTLKSFLLKTIS